MSIRDARILETAYQLINYDDEDTSALLNDLIARYGEDYGYVYDEALNLLIERGIDVIREIDTQFVEKILMRMSGLGNALYILKLVGLGGNERVIRAQFRLSGLDDKAVDDLIRAGALMHKSRDIVFTPDYLMENIMNAVGDVPKPSVSELLSTADLISLSVLEAAVFNLKIIDWIYEAIYGLSFRSALKRAKINGLMESIDGEPVFNPVIEPQDIRSAIYEIKDSGARYIKRVVSPHGQYVFSRLIRCGVVYTVFGGVDKELLLLCPWITPSIGLIKYHSDEERVIISMQKPSDEFLDEIYEHIYELPLRTGIVFINGNKALVLKPRHFTRSFDSFLDFLYRSNISIEFLD